MAVRFDARSAERLERIYAAPEIVEQRARTRAALAARPGERGLDIGCGPGLLAVEVAREVAAGGRVVATDTSPEMLQATSARARREHVAGSVAVLRADATGLPFADGAFDFAVAVQVYLYVADVERALAETARVLRPGGRCVIVDTDWDSCVWLTGDRERHRQVLEARMREFAHPHLPARLPRLLREAGLRLGQAAVVPLLEVRYDPDSFGGDMIRVTSRIAARHGMPAAEAEAWAADLRRAAADGEWFFSVNRYLFLATKP